MMPSRAFWSLFVAALLLASPSFAEVLGDTTSNGLGSGTIRFEVDPSADPEYVAQQLNDHVRITEGGQLTSLKVENGVATLEFAKSTPDVLVEAVIDDDLAALLKGSSGAAASGGSGPGAAGLAVAGAAAAGGVGYGIYKAVDGDDSDDQPTGTPAQ